MNDLDFVTLGTTLIHSGESYTVVGETPTAWKASCRGLTVAVVKSTMLRRGGLASGRDALPFVTSARAADNDRGPAAQREIAALLRTASVAQLEAALTALRTPA